MQVSGQPDCEETQSERRPSRYRISTASTGWPSAVWKSALTVPSRERASSMTSSVENGTSSVRARRSGAGTFVISSYPVTPRAVHSHTWLAR